MMNYLVGALASTGTGSTGVGTYIFIGVAIALGFGIVRLIANRRNRERTDEVLAHSGAVANDSGELITFTVSPARPFGDGVTALRQLLGVGGEEPRITRYTRAVVVVDSHAVTLTDKKAGSLVTIPAGSIVSVAAEKVKLRPMGSYPITIPALTLVVRRGESEESLVLAPITGLHDAVPLPWAQQLAAAIRDKVGVANA